MKNLVLYHADCLDGFGSAYIVWREFGDGAYYKACTYGKDIREFVTHDAMYANCYILDFSLPIEQLEFLKTNHVYGNVVILDHHKTAFDMYKNIPTHPWLSLTLKSNMSGVGITWEHFNKGAEPPHYVKYIQDRDLWRFVFKDTETYCAALQVYDMKFDIWHNIIGDHNLENMLNEGRAILSYQKKVVEDACRYGLKLNIKGHQAIMVNASTLISETCHRLLELNEDCEIAASYGVGADHILVSLRSRKGGVDVAKIAESFGGGGHHNAAGFKIKPSLTFSAIATTLA